MLLLPTGTRPGGRRLGRAAPVAALLVACAGAVAIAVLALGGLRPRGETRAPQSQPREPEPNPTAEAAGGRAPPRLELGFDGASRAPAAVLPEPPAYPAELLSGARFEGRGRIEGSLVLRAGAAPPSAWTLVLEPSKVLIGGERAETRRVEFGPLAREFALEDVALGGYEIRAEAEGLCGASELVLLARPDETSAVVQLALAPCGFLEGRVIDEDGAPLAGVPVHLRRVGGRRGFVQETDARGCYRFESLPDGEYVMHLASEESPLGEPRSVALQAPGLRMPDLRVPALAEAEVRVVDGRGAPVEGARVEAWSSAGGGSSARTDAGGAAVLRFLAPGRARFLASHPGRPDLGQGRAHATLERGARARIEVVLAP